MLSHGRTPHGRSSPASLPEELRDAADHALVARAAVSVVLVDIKERRPQGRALSLQMAEGSCAPGECGDPGPRQPSQGRGGAHALPSSVLHTGQDGVTSWALQQGGSTQHFLWIVWSFLTTATGGKG